MNSCINMALGGSPELGYDFELICPLLKRVYWL
jgi:hypothetical protein